ncbi:MAG: aminoglycoside phosphotransferase family protein [Oscillospiraceae bacterium]|nr:aminoglycoside phosphotransferase family protein [Oscillospiraceae bacterium]
MYTQDSCGVCRIKQELLSNWMMADVRMEVLDKGISSNACLITKGDTKYILRRLSSWQQGYMEDKIAAVLSPLKISPRIIPSCSGHSFVAFEGSYYNLQDYVRGKQVHLCDEPLLQQAAKTVATMHKAMSALTDDLDMADRFSLLRLLESCKWDNLQDTLITQEGGIEKFRKLCQSLTGYDREYHQWIHGDLGTWNLLSDNAKVMVIDFGECRKGSIYFDVAAIVSSLLSSTEDTAILDRHISVFTQTYAEYNVPLDRDLLSKYFQLWFARGILANILEENHQKGKSEKAINYFWKQMNKFSCI